MATAGGILLVTGGDPVMSETFEEHGRAYWSAEFALVLEKHGWLDFTEARPDVLEDAENLRGHAAVIVAWLPEAAWEPAYLESLRTFDGVLLLEGPFPKLVEEFLEIERSGRALPGARGGLRFSDGASRYIRRRFGDPFPIGHRSSPDPGLTLSAGGDPNPVGLSPRESVTRRPGLSRDAYSQVEPRPMAKNAGLAAVSMTLAYRARFAQNDRFFDDPVEDSLALLACVRCLGALPGGGALDDAFARLVRDAAGSNRPPVALTHERGPLARAIWGVALAEAASALGDSTFAERAKEIVGDVRHDWNTQGGTDPTLSRWRALLAAELTRHAAPTGMPGGAPLASAFIPDASRHPTPLSAWLDSALARTLPEASVRPKLEASEWISRIASALESSDGGDIGSELDGLAVPELALVLGPLRRMGHTAAARRLWRLMVEALYDTRQGFFVRGSVVGGKLAPAMGFAISPLIALGLLDGAGPIDIVDAPTLALEGYTPEQLDAWTAAPYILQPYSGPGDETVAGLLTGEGELPVLWQRGNVIATSLQVLGHLVHVHTVEPLAEPFAAFRSGDAIVLEYLLMHLLGSALAARDPAVVTVGPWPWEVAYGLTIRHDVDRVLDERQFRELREFEKSSGLAVSWFWLPDRLEPEQLAELRKDPTAEIALHAVHIDAKPRELSSVGAGAGSPITGEAIHGSGDGWLGYSSVRAAVEAGLHYTELAPPIADCPYARYPRVDERGRVDSERIIGVTYNISIEGKLGTEPGSEGGPGLYRQLLNHPDLNFDRLQNWVAALPDARRVDWTCEQVARWWHTTHVAGNLSITHMPSNDGGVLALEVVARERIEDLELRIPCRPNAVAEVSIDAAGADWAPLEQPEHTGVRVRITLGPNVPRSVVVRSAAAGRPTDALDRSATPLP